MVFFHWNEQYSINVKSMDEQHKKLIDIINDYYECIVQKKTKEGTIIAIKELVDYTKTHFSQEEALLKKHAYPGFEDHKPLHTMFIDKIEDIQHRFEQGRMVLSLEITNFLKDWLINHIQKTDKQYAIYLNGKGIF
jgi:hemerythrin